MFLQLKQYNVIFLAYNALHDYIFFTQISYILLFRVYFWEGKNPPPFHNKTSDSCLSTCGADRDDVGTLSVIFYEWEIKKESENATIPPQPSTLLNHQSPVWQSL